MRLITVPIQVKPIRDIKINRDKEKAGDIAVK